MFNQPKINQIKNTIDLEKSVPHSSSILLRQRYDEIALSSAWLNTYQSSPSWGFTLSPMGCTYMWLYV